MRFLQHFLFMMLLLCTTGVCRAQAAVAEEQSEQACQWIAQQQQKSQAFFSDTSQTNRLSSPRYDRTVSPAWEKVAVVTVARLSVFNNLSDLFNYRCGRFHLAFGRFVLRPSCKYFIFALHQMLC